jgi:hypothetical protein
MRAPRIKSSEGKNLMLQQQPPQPIFQTGTADSGHGVIQTILNTQTNQQASVFIRTDFGKGSPLAGPAAGVYVAVSGGNATIAEATATYSPLALNKYLRATLPAMERGPFNVFRAAITDYHAGNETVRIELATPTPETSVTRPIRDRAVRLYDAASRSGQMEMATRQFDLEPMSGLVAAGALSTLPPDVAMIAMDRFIALRFAARQGLAAKYPAKATATNPVAIGVDNDAMMGEANAFVAAMKANAHTVQQAIQICRDVITWLALATETSTDEAFAMLTAPTNPN